MRLFFLFFSLCIFPTICFSQSTDQNYLKKTIYRGENSTNPQIQIVYYDGLGRSIQNILNGQASDGNDIITHIEYNPNGLQVKEFLPYVRPQSLDYDYNADENSYGYYNNAQFEDTTNPYVENSLEKSPMKRVLKTAHPGNEWKMGNDREIKYDYKIQTDADKVVWFSSGKELLATNVYKGALERIGYYHTGMLKKNIVKNENWESTQTNILDNTTEIFTDDNGYKVLERKYNENVKHDTYFVYDINGNLTYVIPPIVSTSTNISSDDLDKYCYQYKYDVKNRLVEKKLPGNNWEYFVYDKNDRIVLTQNALQKGKEWNFVKYDVLNRVLYSGIFTNTSSQQVMQNAINSMNANAGNNEERSVTPFTSNGITIYYTKKAFPTGSLKVTSINYYDNYTNIEANNFESFENHTLLIADDIKLKGLITANYTNILGSTNWDKNIYYYDNKYLNLIKSEQKNYLGGYTIVQNKIDFSNKVLKTETLHKRLSSDNEIKILENFVYTDQDLLSNYSHKIADVNPQNIFYQYDALNRLINKKILGESTSNSIQSINYKYNVRNWLTAINDVEEIEPENDLFSMFISYTVRLGRGAKGYYDGNIAMVGWKTKTDDILRRYNYNHDNLSRLTQAVDMTHLGPTNKFIERISYDANGNILTLSRTGDSYDYQSNEIDNLTYTYDGNRLMKVTDSIVNCTEGFQDGNTLGDDYAYDLVGNLTKDLNKGITSIKYNHLNLPIEIIFPNGKIIYTYDGNGIKKQKIIQPTNGNIQTTEYLNGFQYLNGELQFFVHGEGYVKPQENGTFLYVYQYKDHLGNVRLSYADLNGDGIIDPASEILEENNYYPSGLKHEGYNQIVNINRSEVAEKYKFGGKEYQDEFDLNWYDFHARNYDAAIGRWLNMDPLADLTLQPYSYANNNPIRFIDPTGMFPEGPTDPPTEEGTTLPEMVINFNRDEIIDYSQGVLNGMLDDVFGTDFRNVYAVDSKSYRSGVRTSHSISITASGFLIFDGLMNIGSGSMGLVGSATLASTGVGAPVAGVTGTASGALILKGVLQNMLGANIAKNALNNMANDSKTSERTMQDNLPRDRHGEPAPDPEAAGRPHSQIGTRVGKDGKPYKQVREFDSKGKPVRDIDFTDHNKPRIHPNPHYHRYIENETGGTLQREKKARPLE